MKRCPECRRDYYDDTLSFCLDDGVPLLDGPAADEPATAILSDVRRGFVQEKESGVETDPRPGTSIAVLPFANLSADPENEYFCDGLAEELMNALAKIDGLKVAARTSSFSFKGKNMNVAEIARALNVTSILDGSVRKSGSRLRIAVQLVNASDGYDIWSEIYDREMQDIFDVQENIALAVVDALKVKLVGEEKAAMLARQTNSTEAYQLYLRGRFFWNRRTEASIRRGIVYFNDAIAVDPAYAAAYTGLSDCYTLLVVREAIRPGEGFPLAKTNAEKALKIDRAFAEAHASLGHALLHNWDWAAAERELKEAIGQKPDYPSAHQWYSEYLTAMGRHDDSISELRLAADLDPLSLVISADLGRAYYYGRQYNQVFIQEAKTLEMDPNFWLSHINIGRSCIQTAAYERAIRELQIAVEILPGNTEALAFLGFAFARSGDIASAERIIDDLREAATRSRVPPYHFAILYAGSDDQERAFEALESAFEHRAVDFFTLGAEPMFDGLRSVPRFTDLLQRVGLPQQFCAKFSG